MNVQTQAYNTVQSLSIPTQIDRATPEVFLPTFITTKTYGFCSMCSKELLPTQVFCDHCGTSIDHWDITYPSYNTEKGNSVMVRTNTQEQVIWGRKGCSVNRIVRKISGTQGKVTGEIKDHGYTVLVECQNFTALPRTWHTVMVLDK
jgi:hypothetical protein